MYIHVHYISLNVIFKSYTYICKYTAFYVEPHRKYESFHQHERLLLVQTRAPGKTC